MSESETFGRYTLLEPIAEGGMGEVWKARSESGLGLGKIVALKRIAERLGSDDDFVSMFVEEARISLALSHPNIVQVFDAGREGRRLYLAMEHVEGKNLHDVIQRHLVERGAPLPERCALTIAAEVARALDHAHRRRGADGSRLGIVHRDVSPGNVLVAFEGDVKLGDFGLAKSTIRAYQSLYGTIKGKAAYMAPEQARAEPVDARTDVFGLGAVLYEMLTGEGPYARAGSEREMMEAARHGGHPAIRAVRPDVAPDLGALVDRALAAKPEARFPSADELRRAIEGYAAAAGHALSVADLAEWMTGLYPPAFKTRPPHPFAQALGEGLGLGPGPLSISVSAPTARLGPEARAALAEALARNPGRPTPEIAAAVAAAVDTPPAPMAPSPRPVEAPPGSATGGRPEPPTVPRSPIRWAEAPTTEIVRRGGRWRLPALALVAVGAFVAVAALLKASPPPSPPPTPSPALTPTNVEIRALAQARPPPSPRPTTEPAPPLPAAADRRRIRGAATPPPAAAAAPSEPPAAPPAVAVPEADAVVSIASSPWADVTVDGKSFCRTPLTCRKKALRPGKHEIVFRNGPANRCARRVVVLESGSNPDLTVDLDPCP